MTRGVARALVLASVVAGFVAANADGAHRLRDATCAQSAGTPAAVGTVLRIYHTSLYVRNRYVGAAPCDLAAADDLRTDGRGEVLFQLLAKGRTIRCVVFPLANILLYPNGASSSTPVVAARFSAGRTWCVSTGSAPGAYLAAGAAEIFLGRATFSIEVARDAVLVKVGVGAVTVRARGAKRVTEGYAILVSRTGAITGPRKTQFDAKDGLAIARLR